MGYFNVNDRSTSARIRVKDSWGRWGVAGGGGEVGGMGGGRRSSKLEPIQTRHRDLSRLHLPFNQVPRSLRALKILR